MHRPLLTLVLCFVFVLYFYWSVPLALARSPRQQAPAESPALRATRAEIEKACVADEFSGTALVASQDQALWTEACGLADREHKTAMTVDARLPIASMGKMFTTISILQLLEAGKVDLDAPLVRYIYYPNVVAANKVTIRHLLTHTGGTGDIFTPEFAAHRLELHTLDDYMQLFGSRPLEFEPGTKQEYSNFGYILLGVVIEKVSGQSYYDYVHDHIFQVAGMTATDYPVMDPLPSSSVVGYTRMGTGAGPQGPPMNGSLNRVTVLPYRGTSAGDAYSTVGDLNRFAQALLNGKLVSAKMLEHIVAGDLVVAGKNYNWGFARNSDNGHVWVGAAGGIPGENGFLRIYPKERIVILTLANLDPPSAMKVSDELSRAVW
jgi:D-alanyl-D-alanine carboxypeptidase